MDKKILEDKEYIKLIAEWKKYIDSSQSRSMILFGLLQDKWIK